MAYPVKVETGAAPHKAPSLLGAILDQAPDKDFRPLYKGPNCVVYKAFRSITSESHSNKFQVPEVWRLPLLSPGTPYIVAITLLCSSFLFIS